MGTRDHTASPDSAEADLTGTKPRRTANLVLIGFMATGKSTVGRLCAERLGYHFQDSDDLIEERAGCSIADLFAARGEASFRRLEREIIAELAATSESVIATGGGAPQDPQNARNLRAGGLVVLLTASPEQILERVGDARTRPLLSGAPDPAARIRDLLKARASPYEQTAHHHVDTTGRTPEEVAAEILNLYKQML